MKKLFNSDRFFLAVTIIGAADFALATLIGILSYPGYLSVGLMVGMVVLGLCLIFLHTSYRKHSKNVMKGLLGALLMAGLIFAIECVDADALILPVDKACAPLNIILTVCLFINHFIINSDHHSSPTMVRLNQILCLLLALVWIVWNVVWACVLPDFSVVIATFAIAVGKVCIYAAIVCVESRLDAYRIEREAKGYKA